MHEKHNERVAPSDTLIHIEKYYVEIDSTINKQGISKILRRDLLKNAKSAFSAILKKKSVFIESYSFFFAIFAPSFNH